MAMARGGVGWAGLPADGLRSVSCIRLFAGPHRSMNTLACEPVSAMPVWTLWTPVALVINALLVWAADDLVHHGHGLDAFLLQEIKDRGLDLAISADIWASGMPAVHVRLTVFLLDDPNGDLARELCIRAVEGHGGRWAPTKSSLGLLAQT